MTMLTRVRRFFDEDHPRLLQATAAIVTTILASVLLYYAISGARAASQVARISEIQACRAKAHLPVDDTSRRLNFLLMDVIGAKDRPTFDALSAQVPKLREATNDAFDVYEAAVTRSVEHPDAFLAECRAAP